MTQISGEADVVRTVHVLETGPQLPVGPYLARTQKCFPGATLETGWGANWQRR